MGYSKESLAALLAEQIHGLMGEKGVEIFKAALSMSFECDQLKDRNRTLEGQLGIDPEERNTVEHAGLRPYRLADNPREQEFINLWVKKQEEGQLLAILLGENNSPGFVSPRDAKVAATIVQWLGTHVGDCFLEQVGYTRK